MARVLPREAIDEILLKKREALMARVIPQEIIFDILSRLPVKPLIRFRCVCKSWCDLFKNPNFIRKQLKHSKEKEKASIMLYDSCFDQFHMMIYGERNHDPSDTQMMCRYPFQSRQSEVTIFGSCNGVLCLKVTDHRWHMDYICLWNPVTKEYNELPRGDFQPDPLEGEDSKIEEIYGFGCDRNLEDYKVVSITYNHEGDLPSGSEVNVYTVGSDSWRKIQGLPYDLAYTRGVNVNGALHWIADRGCGLKKYEKIILSLDLGNEEYGEVPQPVYKDKTFNVNVGVLEGCLCIICNVRGKRVDVWMMKDYGVRESWIKMITIHKRRDIPFFTDLIPIKILKNGDIFFNDGNTNALLYYDSKKKRVKGAGEDGVTGCVEAFVGSLVSLKSGTYVRRKKRTRQSEPRWWDDDGSEYDDMNTMVDESDD